MAKIAVIGLKGLPAFGGAATVGENIIEQLKSKHDFTVYSISSHTSHSGKFNGFDQIVFKKIPNKRLNTLIYYFKAALHAVLWGNYDLIHLHHSDAAFIIPLLKIRFKVILTTHGAFTITEKWARYSLYFKMQVKYFTKYADILTCVSLTEKRMFESKLGLQAIHISNGINKISETTCLDFNSRDGLFFGAGRIIKSKGCAILLKALININYKGKLYIAGDINQTPSHRDEILDLSKNINAEFLGLIKDKPSLFAAISKAKYFIFPSSKEAMSIMLLEAASLKVPIICSDIQENKDIFNDEEVLFFKTNDIYDLSQKILWAFNNPVIMENKSIKAYEKLSSEYTWDVIKGKYDDIFMKLENSQIDH